MSKNTHACVDSLHILVTSGATREMIDPVRFISNLSSGKQGNAIAEAFYKAGAKVTLVTTKDTPKVHAGISRRECVSAEDMYRHCKEIVKQGVDVVVAVAAICDWKPVSFSDKKLKKQQGQHRMNLSLEQTVDVVASIAASEDRPRLVIGFAAETDNIVEYASKKRLRKKLDWVVANPVQQERGTVFGRDENHVILIKENEVSCWETMSKNEVAKKLVEQVQEYFDK